MNLSQLLKYVEDNATDVADLDKVHRIRRLGQLGRGDDPYRKTMIQDLRQRYGHAVQEAMRREGLDEPPVIV